MYQSGLAPEVDRPAFSAAWTNWHGKTKTVEAIAELLHGDEKKITQNRIAASFRWSMKRQNLLGLLPVIFGHRETTPLLTSAAVD